MGRRNKKRKSVAVAIIDGQAALRRAHFGLGAHFVVFESAMRSFRQATELCLFLRDDEVC
jgi:hypothetical protein